MGASLCGEKLSVFTSQTLSVYPALDKWKKGTDHVVLPLPGGHTLAQW